MKVTVLHNISRDASFGLNQVFSTIAGKHYEPCSHDLVRVFEFDTDDLLDPDVNLAPEILGDVVYRVFNVGHETHYYQDEREHELALAYRARRLRSLSTGDVLLLGEIALDCCVSFGWEIVSPDDLRIINTAEHAEKLIRLRYDFKPGEPLSLTVPLEG